MVRKRGVGWTTASVRGDLAVDSRAAELGFAFAVCVGRRRAVPLVGESPGVERRKLDYGRRVREEELVARSVDVDEERVLLARWGTERVGTRSEMRALNCSRRRGASGGSHPRLEGIRLVTG